MSELIHNLRALVEVDLKRHATEEKIKNHKNELDKVAKSYAESEADRDKIAKELVNAKKLVNKLELDAKDLRSNEETKRDALNKATNTEICESLQKEINTIRSKSRGLENELVRSWHELDLSKKKLQEIETSLQKETEEYDANVAKLSSEITKLSGEHTVLSDMRKDMIVALPQEWQVRYLSMQRTVPNLIVPAISGMCSSCFYHIIPRDAELLKKKEILECKGCYRLLYQDIESEADK